MDCNYLNHKEEFVQLRTFPKVEVICCYYEDRQRVYRFSGSLFDIVP